MRHRKTPSQAEPRLGPSPVAAAQPLARADRARADQDQPGEGQGGQARGREADHAREARRPSLAAPGALEARPGQVHRPQAVRGDRAPVQRSAPAATRGSSSSARAAPTPPRWSTSSWSRPASRPMAHLPARRSPTTAAPFAGLGGATRGCGPCRASSRPRSRSARRAGRADRRRAHRRRASTPGDRWRASSSPRRGAGRARTAG